VVGAAGAIYVLGGVGGIGGTLTFYHDVWVSTDGGALRTRFRGDGRVLQRCAPCSG
jgi:hypothetical protein